MYYLKSAESYIYVLGYHTIMLTSVYSYVSYIMYLII